MQFVAERLLGGLQLYVAARACIRCKDGCAGETEQMVFFEVLYNKVLRFRMRWLFRLIWSLFYKVMERNLLGANPKLRIFALYKLCYICLL